MPTYPGTPIAEMQWGVTKGSAPTTYHSRVSWARSLPAPLRRPLSRLVHAAWEGAADLGAVGPGDPVAALRTDGRGGCLLFPQGSLYNEHLIHVGSETIVGPDAHFRRHGARSGDADRPGRLYRESPLIGRGSHIVGHWEIVIGDDIQTGPYVYITDQNHTYVDPVEPIGRQWPTESPVRIGSGSWLGANAVILPGAQIGEHVVVAAGAVVRGDVPDRCVVAGVPARVVQRWVEGTAGSTRRTPPTTCRGVLALLVTVSGQDGPGISERSSPRWPNVVSRSTTSSRCGCTAGCCSVWKRRCTPQVEPVREL